MMAKTITYSLMMMALLLSGCDGKLGRPDLLWLLAAQLC